MNDAAKNPDVEIIADGRTVWVNSTSGSCIGRFSRNGVDVHRNHDAQARGESECLDCIHGLPFDESWARFVASMMTFHDVEIADKFKPRKPNA